MKRDVTRSFKLYLLQIVLDIHCPVVPVYVKHLWISVCTPIKVRRAQRKIVLGRCDLN